MLSLNFFEASAGSAWHNDLLKYAHQEFPVYGPGHAMYFGTSQDLGFHPAHGAGCGSVWFGLVCSCSHYRPVYFRRGLSPYQMIFRQP